MGHTGVTQPASMADLSTRHTWCVGFCRRSAFSTTLHVSILLQNTTVRGNLQHTSHTAKGGGKRVSKEDSVVTAGQMRSRLIVE